MSRSVGFGPMTARTRNLLFGALGLVVVLSVALRRGWIALGPTLKIGAAARFGG